MIVLALSSRVPFEPEKPIGLSPALTCRITENCSKTTNQDLGILETKRSLTALSDASPCFTDRRYPERGGESWLVG